MGTDEGQEEATGLEKTPKVKAAPVSVSAKGMGQVGQNLHVVNLCMPGAPAPFFEKLPLEVLT